MGFGEKSGFSPNFWPYYSMAIWRLWAQKLINTISAEFSLFPSKNHDSIVFMQFCPSNFLRKSQKMENNENLIFYFIFCIFLKNSRVELSFQCRNEFCMPKYPNNRLAPSGTLWHTVWHRLAPSGTRLAPSGAVWRPSGTLWHRLALSGTVWHCLAPSGAIWRRLAPSERRLAPS